MNNSSSTAKKARSLVLSALVLVAIGTSILSALYVAGIVGHSSTTQQTATSQISPGGFMLARNATLTTCLGTTTNGTQTSQSTNSTTTSECLPNGIR